MPVTPISKLIAIATFASQTVRAQHYAAPWSLASLVRDSSLPNVFANEHGHEREHVGCDKHERWANMCDVRIMTYSPNILKASAPPARPEV